MKKSPRKVLVIDDDLTMVRLLEKRLHVDGYHVIQATTGAQGVVQARAEIPDLIVLDLMIPDMNGAQVARQLRENTALKETPIIFITATMGVENDKGNEEIEIDGELCRIFAKPLHNKKLLSTIRKSINRRIHGG